MKIKSEWELIDLIKGDVDDNAVPGLTAGIGDDCAVFKLSRKLYGLLTTDISIENIHFKTEVSKPEMIGRKAMTGNISDIAAMGGVPKFAVVSIGIPESIDSEYVRALYKGMGEVAAAHGVAITGGDTSRSVELILNIALYGEADKKMLVTRAGAQPGDRIFVTGTLGDSAAGLDILLSGEDKGDFPTLVARHLDPKCRLGISRTIVSLFSPTAMIDISDGLLSDLRQISAASGTGFTINCNAVPISTELEEYSLRKKRDPRTIAMESGEEYELLFTASDKLMKAVPDTIEGISVTGIGHITEKGLSIEKNGALVDAPLKGYDHFNKG